MLSKQIQGDMQIALGIAQFIAPIETGNLRYNAIMAERTNDGFRIRYSLAYAYYIYFLEEGTQKSTIHQGFIANETVPTIASYLSAKYEVQDQKTVNHFKYYARIGNEDIFGTTKEREKASFNSIKQVMNGIPERNGWKHQDFIENYDENFRERRLL